MTWTDIPGIINDMLRGLTAWLCEFIYPGIASAYELFENIGSIAFAKDFTIIYNKVSLVIGIFMVFRITFWLIELLINPDSISDKEKNPSKIIQKVVLVVILLAMTPTIFEWAFEIQQKVLDTNIIGKVVGVGGKDDEAQHAGRYMAASLFMNFYISNVDENGQYDEDCADFTGQGIHYSNLIAQGKFNNLSNTCLTKRFQNDPKNGYSIDFAGIFAVLVGGFVFWMIVMYCISAGTRYIQLIYLQIIAPIPIMCYLAPGKDNMFEKWIKQCTTTYLDLFLRIAIINFVMLLSNMILSSENNFIEHVKNMQLGGWVNVFLILGLMTFAKKAPDLIKELIPSSSTKAMGDFGLSWKKRKDAMLGGQVFDRAYGAAAVGLNTIQRNFRTNTGKLFDAISELNAKPPERKEGESDADYNSRVEKFKNEQKQRRRDVAKWAGRATFGAAFSGLGGMRRGFMTTDRAGRQTATDNAVARTQSAQKLHDAGYGGLPFNRDENGKIVINEGFKHQIDDIGRGFLGRDQHIEEYSTTTEAAIDGLRNQISEIESSYNGPIIQKSKTGTGYLVMERDGTIIKHNMTEEEIKSKYGADGETGIDLAKMYKNLGKMKSRLKAIQQKAEEEKQKQGK